MNFEFVHGFQNGPKVKALDLNILDFVHTIFLTQKLRFGIGLSWSYILRYDNQTLLKKNI